MKRDSHKWYQTTRVYEQQNPERAKEMFVFVESLANFVEHHLEILDREVLPVEFRALVEAGFDEMDPEHLTFGELVECLVILTQTWDLHEQLWHSFTYFEKIGVAENLAEKIAVSQKEAAEESSQSSI